MEYICIEKCRKNGKIYRPGDKYNSVPGEKFNNRNFTPTEVPKETDTKKK